MLVINLRAIRDNILRAKRAQLGSSLIEVLIALFVLAIGMLGVLAMQSNAVRASKNAELYSQSQILALGVYESMKATPSEFLENYKLDLGVLKPKPNCSNNGNACSSAEMINWQLHDWQASIANSLPAGRGGISIVNNEYVISVEFTTDYTENSSGSTASNTLMHQLTAVF